jgi:hypothetical protein
MQIIRHLCTEAGGLHEMCVHWIWWWAHYTRSILVITHKLNFSEHMLVCTFFLLWYVELLPKICPHFKLHSIYGPQIHNCVSQSQSLTESSLSFAPPRFFFPFLLFLVWDETESTWHVGHYLACCTSPGWWMMSVEQSVEWVAREREVLGANLPQCWFARHKFHITWPGFEPGPHS